MCIRDRNSSVDERERLKLFEQTVLPHLDAAYNLARWLAGNDHDAQDVTQEASLRAFKFFGSFRGENARAWLLTIVRNTFYTVSYTHLDVYKRQPKIAATSVAGHKPL